MRKKSDILIVGAGIAGASLAYEVAENQTVTILERESATGYHTTGRSAAVYIASYGNAPVRALTRASRTFFEAPPENFTEGNLLSPRSVLTIATEEQVAMLEEHARLHDLRLLSASGAADHVPLLRDNVVGATIETDAFDIDADLLLQGYLRAARGRGAELRLNEGFVSAKRLGGTWLVTTTAGSYETEVIVCAAGAWGDEIAGACGVKPLGLTPMRRTAVLVDPPTDVPIDSWPLVITIDETLYFKPDAGKLLVSPADETPCDPCDAQAEEWDVAVGIDRLQTIADIPVRRVSHRWAGLRTFARDRSPVVGFDDDRNFFWFVGQGGYGLQMAPALARLGAALLLGAEVPADLKAEGLTADCCGPNRFKTSPSKRVFA